MSAGGWLARLALGGVPYNGETFGLAPLVHTLLTLGTPHQSLEAYPFGRAEVSCRQCNSPGRTRWVGVPGCPHLACDVTAAAHHPRPCDCPLCHNTLCRRPGSASWACRQTSAPACSMPTTTTLTQTVCSRQRSRAFAAPPCVVRWQSCASRTAQVAQGCPNAAGLAQLTRVQSCWDLSTVHCCCCCRSYCDYQ